jgi:hypothetical protein
MPLSYLMDMGKEGKAISMYGRIEIECLIQMKMSLFHLLYILSGHIREIGVFHSFYPYICLFAHYRQNYLFNFRLNIIGIKIKNYKLDYFTKIFKLSDSQDADNSSSERLEICV